MEKPMKNLHCLAGQPLSGQRASIRHILLGRPEAIRQTIHLLHRLHYAEAPLWSPILTVEERLAIAPSPGEAISLLRKQL
jgi:hypothetical protein